MAFSLSSSSNLSSTLFLGDLSIFCQESDIYHLFNTFGPIERIEIKKNEHSGPQLTYAFIKFKFAHSAEMALRQVNGTLFMGRFIRMNWAVDNQFGKLVPVNDDRKNKRTAQVHVTFNSKNINMLVSESTLRTLFSQFGDIYDVTINKTSFDKDYGFQSGYGFVHFPLTEKGVAAAFAAVTAMNKTVHNLVAYECTISHGLRNFLSNFGDNSSPRAAPVRQVSPHPPAINPTIPVQSPSVFNMHRVAEPHSMRPDFPPVLNHSSQFGDPKVPLSEASFLSNGYSITIPGSSNSSISTGSSSSPRNFDLERYQFQQPPQQMPPRNLLAAPNQFAVPFEDTKPTQYSLWK